MYKTTWLHVIYLKKKCLHFLQRKNTSKNLPPACGVTVTVTLSGGAVGAEGAVGCLEKLMHTVHGL